MDITKQFLLECLKERYDYEQFRRNNFDNQIGLPVTIVALLIGGLTALVFSTSGVSNVTKFAAIVSLIPLGISIYHLAKVFYGADRKYDVLPTGRVINEHYQKLLAYCVQINVTKVESAHKVQPDDLLREDILQWYIQCNDANSDVNDLRAEAFHKSKRWLIFSLVVIFVLLCIHLISTITL